TMPMSATSKPMLRLLERSGVALGALNTASTGAAGMFCTGSEIARASSSSSLLMAQETSLLPFRLQVIWSRRHAPDQAKQSRALRRGRALGLRRPAGCGAPERPPGARGDGGSFDERQPEGQRDARRRAGAGPAAPWIAGGRSARRRAPADARRLARAR